MARWSRSMPSSCLCNRWVRIQLDSFTSLNACSIPQEETEFRSDGTNRVIRSARLSLARVSVLRGDGAKEGIPFIDDHIHTSDVIVDYLTEFSGIQCTFPFPRRTLGTACSRRPGSALAKAHVDTAEACIQEATIAGRSGMHIYRPRTLQGFLDNQSVPSLPVTRKVHSRPFDRHFLPARPSDQCSRRLLPT